jgi:phospholipase C
MAFDRVGWIWGCALAAGGLLAACSGSTPRADGGASSAGATAAATSGGASSGSSSGGSSAGVSGSGSGGNSTGGTTTAGGNGSTGGSASSGGSSGGSTGGTSGLAAVQHVVVIIQENRSFDTYFGTFPGATGLPTLPDGGFATCCPDGDGGCIYPFHDVYDINAGGPHSHAAFVDDLADGGLNGFVKSQGGSKAGCVDPQAPNCTGNQVGATLHDVMGYHDARELPNYWAYAGAYTLQDNFYESVNAWSLPMHLFMVSGWMALCGDAGPSSCGEVADLANKNVTSYLYSWTDLTYVLFNHQVTWKYYLSQGQVPDCDDGEQDCPPEFQDPKVPSIWNPLPQFSTVKDDKQTGNVTPVDQFYLDVKNGTLPQVSWIVPVQEVSEHPPARVSLGQAYVTGLVNAVMQSPYWNDTVILLAWDDWGGFYDQVPPPVIDANGYGFRVPAMVISSFAKQHYVDHQILSHDAYLKFIEDVFVGGARIDPATDGRPDPRPDVREDSLLLGDIVNDLDFSKAAPTLILPQCPYDGGCPCPLDAGACDGGYVLP